MMKSPRLLLWLSLLLVPALGRAQGPVSALQTDFSTRSSVALDWRLVRGLHLEAAYELRTERALSKIDRHQLSLGLQYKFNDWLKGGLSYTFFDRYGTKAGWEPRHRLGGSLTFGYHFGPWRLSLREMLQFTHKTEDLNLYQEPRNALVLKSRLKLQYKGFATVEPYALFELKATLNDPTCKATWNSASASYTNYSFTGYNDTYLSRYRGGLGLEWKLSPAHALNFYGLFDYYYEKSIDTNRAGTELKSLTYNRMFNTTLGVGYTFSF